MQILGFNIDKFHLDLLDAIGKFAMGIWALLFLWVIVVGISNAVTTPFEIITTKIETPVVHAGDTLKVVHTVKEDKSCFVRFSRYIRGIEASNHQTIVQSGWFTTEGESTVRTVDISMPIPDYILPGNYTAFSRYQYRCNFLDQLFPRVRDRGEVSFKVVK
jgi:hypothetical protein